MVGKICQSCRHKHTDAHTHMYAPCHDVHPGTPSQLLTPRAQPVQVDILQEHTQHQKYTHNGTDAVTDPSVCIRCCALCCLFPYRYPFFLLLFWHLCFLTSSHPNLFIRARCRHNTLVGYEQTDGETLQCFLFNSFSWRDLSLLENDPHCRKSSTKAEKIHHGAKCSAWTNTMWDYTVIIPYIKTEGSTSDHRGIHRGGNLHWTVYLLSVTSK